MSVAPGTLLRLTAHSFPVDGALVTLKVVVPHAVPSLGPATNASEAGPGEQSYVGPVAKKLQLPGRNENPEAATVRAPLAVHVVDPPGTAMTLVVPVGRLLSDPKAMTTGTSMSIVPPGATTAVG